VILEGSAFHNFVGALCKLSLEIVSTQSDTDVDTSTGTGTTGEGTLDADDDTIPARVRDAPHSVVWQEEGKRNPHVENYELGVEFQKRVGPQNVWVNMGTDVYWGNTATHLRTCG
jgi:hypothetical protein